MRHFLLSFALLLNTACSSTMSKPQSTGETSPSRGFDAVLSTYDYPFPVRYYSFKSQNQELRMAYMDIAPAKDPRGVFILLHGKNFPGAYFAQIITSLTNEGFRVIVPDQIGFGKSSKPAAYQYSFQTLATNTQGLLKTLGVEKKYKVLGHSMGGMLASRMSLMYPESVTQLFLVNPIGLEDWKTMTSYRSIDENYRAELNNSPEKIRQYQLDSYYDGQWRTEYDKWLEIPTGWIQGPDYPLLAWNAALTSDMIFTQPVFYEFKNIKAPTVLIIGQRDRTAIGKAWAPDNIKKKMGNYPALGKQAARMIPKAKLEELKGLGHMPFIEDYATFWKAMKRHL